MENTAVLVDTPNIMLFTEPGKGLSENNDGKELNTKADAEAETPTESKSIQANDGKDLEAKVDAEAETPIESKTTQTNDGKDLETKVDAEAETPTVSKTTQTSDCEVKSEAVAQEAEGKGARTGNTIPVQHPKGMVTSTTTSFRARIVTAASHAQKRLHTRAMLLRNAVRNPQIISHICAIIAMCVIGHLRGGNFAVSIIELLSSGTGGEMVHPILWPFPLLATMHVLNICLKHRSALDGGIDHFAKRVVDNGVIAFAPLLVHVLLFTVLKTGDESIVLVEPLNERLAALVVVCSLMAPIAKYAFVLLPSTRWPTLLRGTLQIILDTTSVTFVITCAIGACGELHSAESDSLLLQLGLLVSRIISGTIVGSSHLLLTKGVGYSMPAIFSCADSDRCGRTARIFGSCAFQCTVSLLGIGSVPIIAAMMLREGIVILHFVVAINVFLHLKDGISADITAPLTLMRKSISPKSQGNQ